MAKTTLASDTEKLNAQVFYNELDRLMGASISVIAVRTREMNRGKLLMHQWSSMRGLDFHAWDCISGFQSYRPLPMVDGEAGNAELVLEADNMKAFLSPSGAVSGTGDMLAALEHYKTRAAGQEIERNKFCGVFLGVIDDWLKEPMVQQHIRDHVQRGYQCDDRMVLFLTPGTAIPDAIAGDVELIDLATPSFAELMEAFVEMETEIPAEFNYTPDDNDRTVIVQNGMGMTQQEFENAISLAIVDISATLESLDTDEALTIDIDSFVKVVRGRKLEILKQTQILELMPDANMDQIGGLDLLKAELELQRMAFTAEAREYGVRSPKGFLVVGPPGTGKSLVAKAASHALGVAGILFNFASIYNSLVGSSEQRMRACLRMIEEMSPCVVFLDEIDKAIGGGGAGGGDSGVSSRIFGMLLSWMQDKQDKNIPALVVASANNVTSIPPELLRKGRFDDIWSVSFPSPVERAQIFQIHVEQRGHQLSADAYKTLAKATDSFVGAEIETAVEAALLIDFRNGSDGVQLQTILDKIDLIVPQAKAFPERIEAMRKWCEQNARPASSGAVFETEPSADMDKSPQLRTKVRRIAKLARRSTRN